MTTDKHLACRMDLPCKCPRETVHVKCEGSVTPKTAFYPEDFAKRVSRALQQSCSREDLLQELRGELCLLDHFGNGVSCECEAGQLHGAELSCGMCCTKNMEAMKPPHESCHTNENPGILSPDEALRNTNILGNPIGRDSHAPLTTSPNMCPHGGILRPDDVTRSTPMGPQVTTCHHVSTDSACHAPHAGILNPDEATRTSCTGPLGDPHSSYQHGLGTQEISPKDPGLTRAEIQKKLQLLHSATGHGPVRHLIQALRRRGVHKCVLEEIGVLCVPLAKRENGQNHGPSLRLNHFHQNGPPSLRIWEHGNTHRTERAISFCWW